MKRRNDHESQVVRPCLVTGLHLSVDLRQCGSLSHSCWQSLRRHWAGPVDDKILRLLTKQGLEAVLLRKLHPLRTSLSVRTSHSAKTRKSAGESRNNVILKRELPNATKTNDVASYQSLKKK